MATVQQVKEFEDLMSLNLLLELSKTEAEEGEEELEFLKRVNAQDKECFKSYVEQLVAFRKADSTKAEKILAVIRAGRVQFLKPDKVS